MYSNGFCSLAPDGSKLPCPDAYGALIGTCAVCAFTEILISFLSPKVLQRIFPPIVTGPTVMLIGVNLIQTGFTTWGGGDGLCSSRPTEGFFMLCPDITAPHALAWGSAEYIGWSENLSRLLIANEFQVLVSPYLLPFSSARGSDRPL